MGVGANPDVQDVHVISSMLWEAASIPAKTQSQKGLVQGSLYYQLASQLNYFKN